MDELLHTATLMWPQAGGLCGAGLLGGSLACQAGGGVGVIGGVEAWRCAGTSGTTAQLDRSPFEPADLAISPVLPHNVRGEANNYAGNGGVCSLLVSVASIDAQVGHRTRMAGQSCSAADSHSDAKARKSCKQKAVSKPVDLSGVY